MPHLGGAAFDREKSGRQDSNLRPSGPKPDALPDCATPRSVALSEREYCIIRRLDANENVTELQEYQGFFFWNGKFLIQSAFA